ncbi:MAG: phosphatase [Bacteroidetes bacterium]|nr:MAG: phosphatase [Bacteroidota bacterium]
MIKYFKGNLLHADAEALVNTVNTVGVMGKGIALQFKENFPQNYKAYKEAVKRREVEIGKMFVWERQGAERPHYIINFPTKTHWRFPSQLSYITDGLKDLRQVILDKGIQSVAIPPLGCGNGGLDWQVVKPLILEALKDLPAKLIIYEPDNAIKELLKKENIRAVRLTNARAMLLYLLYQYRTLGEEACEFAAEKLAYFLQRFGEKTLKLDFVRHIYGPYSGKVRHVLYALNGAYLSGFEQKNLRPFDEFELMPGKKEEINDFLHKNLSAEEEHRLAQVVKLIDGFQSPYSLELLASVDFILKDNPAARPEAIRATIAGWSSRKSKMFQLWHIEMAVEHLKGFKELYSPE